MKRLTGQQLRTLYKEFFRDREHLVFSSASLVPHNDPTLLWINAGMTPLKSFFDGREIPEKPRIVNAQKCIRTNDIENVGHTARHQTFFEMMGNFSFGDYFKQDAIQWAWDFVTQVLELDPARLSVTVHINDDEAYGLWNKRIGLPVERIVQGEEDNFWEIGEGPCGPCSEIFYDRGASLGCGSPQCGPGCDCDRFLEIWNLVFTQYNKEPDGTYTPLPKKNIDTGMGLERVASVLQEVDNNFETDLFRPIIDRTATIAGVAYGEDAGRDVHFKIIADHVRTVAFAIGDGVLPGNEGRSYIIRRLLRRAVRSGRRLGVERPFLHELAPIVAAIMGDDYVEVREKHDFIQRIIRIEEERFHETLHEGEALLTGLLQRLTADGNRVLGGEDAFRLYDTFGFPIDLTEEIAQEQGVSVDRDGFHAQLEAQRGRARAARQTTEGMSSDRGALETITLPSRFVGYGQLQVASTITAIVSGGVLVDTLEAGADGYLLLAETPFYAESGGQVADTGEIRTSGGLAEVVDVQKAPHGQPLHLVRVLAGRLSTGDPVEAQVAEDARRDTIRNHTATHLLHKALRDVLGTHVAQAGSRVDPQRLRFDFSHFGPLTEDELADVEQRVNDAIWHNDPVNIQEMDIDAAKSSGAMALFGEKYGQRVRVVQAGESIELCGGCHVGHTGIIGLFRLVSETGIGAGVRRIEAVTGRHAYQHVRQQTDVLRELAGRLKVPVAEVLPRLDKTLEDVRSLERELESARVQLNRNRAQALLAAVVQVGDIPVLAAQVSGADMDELRGIADELRAHITSGVIVLGSVLGGKVSWVATVSRDLQARKLHAGQLVKRVAEMTGGSGGGRPELAQAGGKDPSQLARAVESVAGLVREHAGNVVG